jgi:hypothetical protein
MGAFTGVRRNEALGLRFNDIEWFGNEVNVRHAISKRRGTDGAHKWEWHVGPPKSRKSLRRIAATESVMKMLADLKVGKADGAFILPGDCNGFIDPDKFDLEVWKPIAEKAGMAGTFYHARAKRTTSVWGAQRLYLIIRFSRQRVTAWQSSRGTPERHVDAAQAMRGGSNNGPTSVNFGSINKAAASAAIELPAGHQIPRVAAQPIPRNKTFFLLNYERYREGSPQPLILSVPAPEMRQGDFSGNIDARGRLITVYDPSSGTAGRLKLGARSVPR